MKVGQSQPSTMLVIIVAGGTGGHIFPALAVASELTCRGHRCMWIGRPNSLEQHTANAARIAFYPIRMSGVRGRRIDKQVIALWQSLWGTLQLGIRMRLFARHHQTSVVTFGGYTSIAAGIVARLLHLPLIIHEQNSFAGSANRLLARWAHLVCCGFDSTFTAHPRKVLTGNPIRHKRGPQYRNNHNPLRILVLGGSMGAASLNCAIVTSLSGLHNIQPVHLVHQCGSTTLESTRKAYQQLQVALPMLRLRLQPFLQRIEWYYTWCDVIICRAGAMTLAEVCAAGKYAILIPFPHATDDHQFHNTESLTASGGATVIRDNEQLPQQLTQQLQPLLCGDARKERKHLYQRGKLLTPLAKPGAAGHIADLIEQIYIPNLDTQ